MFGIWSKLVSILENIKFDMESPTNKCDKILDLDTVHVRMWNVCVCVCV
jgi:hypothetical protein